MHRLIQIFLLFFVGFLGTSCATSKRTQVIAVMDTRTKLVTTLHQHITVLELKEQEETHQFLNHLERGYLDYKPKHEVIVKGEALVKNAGSLRVEVLGGNWCSDTHEGIPKFVRVLDECGFNAQHFEYHRVSRDRLQVDGKTVKESIGAVPRVRVWKGEVLLGEIVEFPRISWEADFYEILTQSKP
jgi:hypothetical protein